MVSACVYIYILTFYKAMQSFSALSAEMSGTPIHTQNDYFSREMLFIRMPIGWWFTTEVVLHFIHVFIAFQISAYFPISTFC